jgi:hypothetical protein
MDESIIITIAHILDPSSSNWTPSSRRTGSRVEARRAAGGLAAPGRPRCVLPLCGRHALTPFR